VELEIHAPMRRHQEEVAGDREVISDLPIALHQRDHSGVCVVVAHPSIDPVDRASELCVEPLVQLPELSDDLDVGGR
jgi:hypothetical protein